MPNSQSHTTTTLLLLSWMWTALITASLCFIIVSSLSAVVAPVSAGMTRLSGVQGDIGDAEAHATCHNGTHVFYGMWGAGKIVAFRVSDNARVGSLSVTPTSFHTCSQNDEYAFFASAESPNCRVVKIRMSTLEQVGTTLSLSTRKARTSHVEGDTLWINHDADPGVITKIFTNAAGNMDETTTLTLTASTEAEPYGWCFDETYGYTAFSQGVPSRIVKFNKTSMARKASTTLATGDNDIRTAVIDPTKQYCFYGTHKDLGARIIKVRLSDLARVSVNQGLNFKKFRAVVADALYMYWVMETSPSKILQTQFSDGAQVGSMLTLDSNEDEVKSGCLVTSNIAMFGAFVDPMISVKVELDSSGTTTSTTAAPSPENSLLVSNSEESNVKEGILRNCAGTLKWSISTSDDMKQQTPVVRGDSVYFADLSGNLYGRNAWTGTTQWSRSLGNSIEGSVAVSDDGATLFVGVSTTVSIRSTATGLVTTSYASSCNVGNSHPVFFDGHCFFGGDTCITKITPAGSKVWENSDIGTAYGRPYVDNNDIFLNDQSNKLWRLHAANGTVVWSVTTYSAAYPNSPVARYTDADPNILDLAIVATDKKLEAFHAANGTLFWDTTYPVACQGGPVLNNANGTVFMACDKALKVINAYTGEIMLSKALAHNMRGNMVYANGALFAGLDGDGFGVWAFYTANLTKIFSYYPGCHPTQSNLVLNGSLLFVPHKGCTTFFVLNISSCICEAGGTNCWTPTKTGHGGKGVTTSTTATTSTTSMTTTSTQTTTTTTTAPTTTSSSTSSTSTSTITTSTSSTTEAPTTTTTAATTSTTSTTTTEPPTSTSTSTSTTTTEAPTTTTASSLPTTTSTVASTTTTTTTTPTTPSLPSPSPTTESPTTTTTAATTSTSTSTTTTEAPTTTTSSSSSSAATSTLASSTVEPPTTVEETTQTTQTTATELTTTTTQTEPPQPKKNTTAAPAPPRNASGVPIVSPAAAGVTNAAALTASLAAAGAVGPLAMRNSILRSLTACGEPLEPLDRSLSPLGLTLGEDEYKYWTGCVVGGLILIAGLSLIAFVAVRIYIKVKQLESAEDTKKPIAVARALVGTFWLILAGPVTTGTVASFMHAKEGIFVVVVFVSATVMVVVPLVKPLWILWQVHAAKIEVVDVVRDDADEKNANCIKKLQRYLFAPRNGKDWADDGKGLRMSYGFLFDHSSSLKYVAIELTMGFAISFFGGLMQNPNLPLHKCQIYAILILVFHLPPTFLCLFFNSLTTRFEMVVISALWLGNTVLSVTVVLDFFSVGINTLVLDGLNMTLAAVNLVAGFLAIWSTYDAITYVLKRKTLDQILEEAAANFTNNKGGPSGDGGEANTNNNNNNNHAASFTFDGLLAGNLLADEEIDLSVLDASDNSLQQQQPQHGNTASSTEGGYSPPVEELLILPPDEEAVGDADATAVEMSSSLGGAATAAPLPLSTTIDVAAELGGTVDEEIVLDDEDDAALLAEIEADVNEANT